MSSCSTLSSVPSRAFKRSTWADNKHLGGAGPSVHELSVAGKARLRPQEAQLSHFWDVCGRAVRKARRPPGCACSSVPRLLLRHLGVDSKMLSFEQSLSVFVGRWQTLHFPAHARRASLCRRRQPRMQCVFTPNCCPEHGCRSFWQHPKMAFPAEAAQCCFRSHVLQ